MQNRKPKRNNIKQNKDLQRCYYMISVDRGRPNRIKRVGTTKTVNENSNHIDIKEENKNGNTKENSNKR